MKFIFNTLAGLFYCSALLGQNIFITDQHFPNEPSIMIDPKNPNRLVAGTNLNNYYFSEDTGKTWKTGTLTSSHGVWGDPVISVDTAGNFYFFHLSNSGAFVDRIVCQKSSDNGATWNDGTTFGLNGEKVQDKPWCTIDRRNNNIYLTWTQFDEYGGTDPKDSTIIRFSKSVDGGSTWSDPVKINSVNGDCYDSDNTVEGAMSAVGPNGEIYVSWAGPNGLVFNKSLDQGATWLPAEMPICAIPGGWDYSISGIDRCNGLPVIACDLSKGPNRGTIYINWSDQRNGSTNTDIWLVKSTDGGNTWSTPIKVNDDTSDKQQFMTWMAIDQTSGYLYFIFYDRRYYSNDLTDVALAVSMNGGNTFINHIISNTPFLPNNGIFFGDYTNIVAHNGIIRPIWTRLNNHELSIWTDLTKLSTILSVQDLPEIDLKNYPNPAKDFTYISFKLNKNSKVELTLFDFLGRKACKNIISEERGYGKYIESINLKDLHISAGSYLLRLEIDGKIKISKLIVI